VKSNQNQMGSAIHITIVVVLVVLLLGALGYIFWQNFTSQSTQDPGTTKDESSSATVSGSQDVLVSKDLRTSDNLGITYKIPSTWTGGEYGNGSATSDSETVTLTSEDGFVITMAISRLIRGWTEDSPSSTIVDVMAQMAQ
jgi:cytoskeletal protein RodZ